jgi:hypothetical protein
MREPDPSLRRNRRSGRANGGKELSDLVGQPVAFREQRLRRAVDLAGGGAGIFASCWWDPVCERKP